LKVVRTITANNLLVVAGEFRCASRIAVGAQQINIESELDGFLFGVGREVFKNLARWAKEITAFGSFFRKTFDTEH
jgi:hypothetical protein